MTADFVVAPHNHMQVAHVLKDTKRPESAYGPEPPTDASFSNEPSLQVTGSLRMMGRNLQRLSSSCLSERGKFFFQVNVIGMYQTRCIVTIVKEESQKYQLDFKMDYLKQTGVPKRRRSLPDSGCIASTAASRRSTGKGAYGWTVIRCCHRACCKALDAQVHSSLSRILLGHNNKKKVLNTTNIRSNKKQNTS